MRRARWLILAIGLLGLAGLFLPEEAPSSAIRSAPRVAFPRPNYESAERAKQRRTLKQVIKVQETSDSPEYERPVTRDPLMVALRPGSETVVIEANAILQSPVGQMMFECLQDDIDDDASEKRLQMEHFVNALDRIALGTGATQVFTGQFDEGVKDYLASNHGSGTPYGDAGTLYQEGDQVIGYWNQEMMVMGPEGEVRSTFDRLEGRSPAEEDVFPENLAYGEAYGRVSQDFLLRMMPEREGLAELLEEAASEIELHVDTQTSVAMTFDVRGKNADRIDELARSLGGGLAMLRVKARMDGDEALEHLFDQARISGRYSGGFTVEVAVSQDFLAERMKDCSAAARHHLESSKSPALESPTQ